MISASGDQLGDGTGWTFIIIWCDLLFICVSLQDAVVTGLKNEARLEASSGWLRKLEAGYPVAQRLQGNSQAAHAAVRQTRHTPPTCQVAVALQCKPAAPSFTSHHTPQTTEGCTLTAAAAGSCSAAGHCCTSALPARLLSMRCPASSARRAAHGWWALPPHLLLVKGKQGALMLLGYSTAAHSLLRVEPPLPFSPAGKHGQKSTHGVSVKAYLFHTNTVTVK